jgi:hypothetical protein
MSKRDLDRQMLTGCNARTVEGKNYILSGMHGIASFVRIIAQIFEMIIVVTTQYSIMID